AGDAALIGHKLSSQILMHFTMDQKRESPTVIGIARSIRYGISKGEDRPQVFLSTEQFPARVMSFAVRVRGKTENYLPILGDTVQSIDKEAGVFGVDTLERRREMWTARPRFYTMAVLFLGGF